MGFTSPKEVAALEQQERLARRADDRGPEEARRRFGELQPFFERTRTDMDALIPVLSQLFDVQTAGIGQTLGESLSVSGVARGHDRGRAFTAEMAPAIGAHQQARAQLGQARAATHLSEGQTLERLFGQEDQMIASLLGLQGQSIGMMKDTGLIDDLLPILILAAGTAAGGMGGAGLAGALTALGGQGGK